MDTDTNTNASTEQTEQVTLSRVCEDLGITSAHLRSLLARFGDIIGLDAVPGESDREGNGEGGGPPWRALLEDDWRPSVKAEDSLPDLEGDGLQEAILPKESVAALATILKMRDEGATDEQVREAFSREGDQSVPVDSIESTLRNLARELRQTEKRRAEDRDRLLTALMRTHQEVRQLRNEMAAQTSRKMRKNRSLFSRFFG